MNLAMRLAKIDRQAQDRTQLNHDGVHLPVAVGEADVQQRFRNPQVRGGADGQKFGETFHDSQHEESK